MLRRGAQDALVTLCDLDGAAAAASGVAVSIRRKCAAALWNLTRTDDAHIDAAALIPALIALLRHESDTIVKGDAAAALYNLAFDAANCQRMLKEGARQPIVSLSRSGSVTTKIQCGAILSRLSFQSSDPALKRAMLSAEFIASLLELARLDHRATQQRAIFAIVNLTYERGAHALLLGAARRRRRARGRERRGRGRGRRGARRGHAAAARRPLEQARRADPPQLRGRAQPRRGRRGRAGVLAAGAVPALLIIALVSSDRAGTKELCAKALFNLLYDSGTHEQMVGDGVI